MRHLRCHPAKRHVSRRDQQVAASTVAAQLPPTAKTNGTSVWDDSESDGEQQNEQADVEEEEPKPQQQPRPQRIVATCDKCKEGFESRTKLFKHIEQTGHATLKTAQPVKEKKQRKKKK